MATPKFRLYVDEVGNHDLDARRVKPNERYLSLTGIVLDLEYVRATVSPAIEGLKAATFRSHPDDPVVLHRRELLEKKPPFTALRDPATCARFDAALLALIRNLNFRVMTATIDKWQHVSRYGTWTQHPYHYCMEVLVERYVLDLNGRGSIGDVMAESRGSREDRELKAAFTREYLGGSGALTASKIQERLTSSQLKVKPKSSNVAGLQIADLLAYPSFRAMLWRRNNQAFPANFTGEIAAVLETTKYRRSPTGRIDGWGTKWLP